MHTGKELEAHKVEKGRLGCDSDAPQAGSVRSNSTRVVKVKRRKTNRRKTRPYSILNFLPVNTPGYQASITEWNGNNMEDARIF
jgi:hypothetical protein